MMAFKDAHPSHPITLALKSPPFESPWLAQHVCPISEFKVIVPLVCHAVLAANVSRVTEKLPFCNPDAKMAHSHTTFQRLTDTF